MNIKQLQQDILDLKFKDNNWYNLLRGFLLSEDFTKILTSLHKEFEDGKSFVPNIGKAFRAFELTDPNTVKVVILGQDPYPMLNTKTRESIADGLAFSCSNELRPQPSLRLILNAINKTVYNYDNDPAGFNLDLSYLAQQGVVLLNSALTTQVGKPGSHFKLWSPFIGYVIDMLNNKDIIWLFLGSKAQIYEDLVTSEHKLFATHPASASYAGLKEWECNDVFNKINEILLQQNKSTIIW